MFWNVCFAKETGFAAAEIEVKNSSGKFGVLH
jgi:hypothetical protein